MARTKKLNCSIITRNDTTANWDRINPVLKTGEIAIEKTTSGEMKIKIGNGSSTWQQLKYYEPKSSVVIVDDDTGLNYTIGIASGLVYLEEI